MALNLLRSLLLDSEQLSGCNNMNTAKLERKWRGYWINAGSTMGAPSDEVLPAPYLRKTFICSSKPEKASVFLCGLGWHELYVNGQKADDRVLAPAVTQFDKHVSFIEYDVTHLLQQGKNAVAVLLGNGWYNCQTHEGGEL
jgi:alpha-L-rhamnosidase